MHLKIIINMDNAAFHDDDRSDEDSEDGSDYARGMEVARILKSLADDVQHGLAPDYARRIGDVNGNTVGKLSVHKGTGYKKG